MSAGYVSSHGWCSLCGSSPGICPGGVVWHREHGNPDAGGLCRVCARTAIRAFGEEPDASPAQVIPIRGPEKARQ